MKLFPPFLPVQNSSHLQPNPFFCGVFLSPHLSQSPAVSAPPSTLSSSCQELSKPFYLRGKKCFFPLESVIHVFIVLLTVLNCATLKEGIFASKIKPPLLVLGNESHREVPRSRLPYRFRAFSPLPHPCRRVDSPLVALGGTSDFWNL